jgi:hypothetical protein
MNKLTIASLVGAFLLTACSTTSTTEVAKDWPARCIREAEFLDNDPINGKVLLDMPGYPFGMDDAPMEVSRQTYNELDVDVCTSDDPRMQ